MPTLVKRGGQRFCALAGVETLQQRRLNRACKVGHVRQGALAAEQFAAEFGLELENGTRQRRLRDIAFLGSAREMQRPAHGQKVANLMEFHR